MKRLELLDYGRFFAAIIVVLFHYTFNGIANGKIASIEHMPYLIEFTKYGYLGVELFFMISGFVIFHSAKNRTAAEFSVSRATRLYPSYWFAVIFTSLFALQWGGDLMSVYPSQIIFNLTMLQSYINVSNVDGVYWTLVYEIEFYAAVFLILLFGLQAKLDFLFIFWPIAMGAALILSYEDLPYLGGYFYYFSAGSLFAILKNNKNWYAITSLLISFCLCLLYSIGISASKTEQSGVVFSEYIVAFIITCFFIFFLIQNTEKGQSLKLPLSKTLGALTYPVYLIHAHFGYMFIDKFATEENKITIYFVTVLIVLLVAYLMHRFIEVALSSFWKTLFMSTLYRVISAIQKLPSRAWLTLNKSIN